MRAVGEPDSMRVRFRSSVDLTECVAPLAKVSADGLATACPWRIFRWRQGQRHYSAAYWSATEGAHVIYESRLELARLIYADFDPSVRRIVAQPFLLMGTVGGVERKHVPDYLLVTGSGPVVVDVKPASMVNEPKVSSTLRWTRSAVEGRGWTYEVWSEPPSVEFRNVRFLAGFRRSAHFNSGLLCKLKAADLDNMSLREAVGHISGWPGPVVRSALFHLVWSRYFDVDISRDLSPSHLLVPGGHR
jgi:hypothetical protein